jgi:hypothetical protein
MSALKKWALAVSVNLWLWWCIALFFGYKILQFLNSLGVQ